MPDDRDRNADALTRLAAGARAAPLPGPQPRGRRSAGWVPTGDGPGSAPGPDRVADLRAAVAERLPGSWRGARWALPAASVPVLLLACAAVSVAVLVTVLLAAPSPGRPVTVPARSETAPTAAPGGDGDPVPGPAPATPPAVEPAGGEPASAQPGTVVVHVVGQVVAPGVVTLPAGSRVADAVEAAGGLTGDADVARVNLARPLVDGEQVLVPRPGEELPPPGAAVTTAAPAPEDGGAPDQPLDLNTAGAAELDALPGIGPVLSERIVTWRQEQGRFTSVEELLEVSGIGESLLARLRPLVRV